MPRGIPNKPRTIIGADVEKMENFSGERPAESEKPVAAPVVKKGKRSWGRRDILSVTNKDPNFTYRFVSKNAVKIAQRLEDGWEYCGDVVNSKAIHNPTERMYDGADLTSTIETHDSILMRLPNDLKAERDEWLNETNALREKMLKREAERKAGTALTGSIDIQGGNYKNIIE